LFTFKDEADCMSSVEVLVLDCLDGLLMQPWARLATIISQLNGLPKNVSETDWERLRTYCADRNHSQMRQNIGYGSVLTPDVLSMFASFTNLRGAFILRPTTYPKPPNASADRMLRKLNAPKVQAIGETLSRFFEDKMIPMIKTWRAQGREEAKRTIVYFVSSLRFLHARKLLEETMVNFLETGDDANEADGKRMRRGFAADKNAVVLMTERFYFHYRLHMGAVERVVFMQPPTFPHFASELAGTAEVILYYTEFDEMALERVVGSRALSSVIGTDAIMGV
jgi:U3 small nucleolar RNA-associated protein 25